MIYINIKRFTNVYLLCKTILIASLSSISLAAERPNIVVIMVDDLGYGDLSSYGANDLKTPHVDALLSRGMKLTEFYANCPVCSPTRASFLTGRYPELVGVPGVIRTHAHNNWGNLTDDSISIGEVLSHHGYHTALVGKWHLGLKAPDRPNDRGFKHFAGYLGDMMDDYYNHRRHGINYMRLNEDEIEPNGHATDLFTKWACEYISSRKESVDPFFLFLAYNAPHTPIQPPKEWLQRVISRAPEMDPKRAKLVALIEHLDDGIGQVTDCLKEHGMQDNTLLVFTSDNGGQINVGANNGHTKDGKQSMYEGGLKVPTCAVWPGHIAAGSSSARRMITMDLFPTISEVADIKLNHRIDGVSQLDTLLGNSQKEDARSLFFHRREGGDRYGGLTIQAIRRGDWKLLQNSPFQPLELYNLKEDPLEEHDLARTNIRIFRELSIELRKHIQRGGNVPWQ